METYSLLIKSNGNYNLYLTQKKKTIATENNSIETVVVEEKVYYSIFEAMEDLESFGVEKTEILHTLEVLAQNEHNYASFGINKSLVTTSYVGGVS